ncbi:hypothetical protein F2Q69_00043881 [Brassica cretica]|uniref:Uncharacterized protein n=1 Tax=Brassica cretica TaxID=69181 RepID=A0A8S9NGN2_BRACR|nr:hypothetical protein F2Q69_00043881 [Brassica cretica]
MSGMNNPTLHRHAVHGLQGATPSSCLHDLVPFAGPRHDSPKRLVLELVGYLKPYSTSDLKQKYPRPLGNFGFPIFSKSTEIDSANFGSHSWINLTRDVKQVNPSHPVSYRGGVVIERVTASLSRAGCGPQNAGPNPYCRKYRPSRAVPRDASLSNLLLQLLS